MLRLACHESPTLEMEKSLLVNWSLVKPCVTLPLKTSNPIDEQVQATGSSVLFGK